LIQKRPAFGILNIVYSGVSGLNFIGGFILKNITNF